MYTQCPDCREAFHVTAEILQQAGGRVRCGACGHVFDALDGLSEAPPSGNTSGDDDESSFRDVLDELGDTGNVRLEDTGVEWRVVEEETGTDLAGADEDDQSSASALRWYIRDDPEESGNDSLIPEAGGAPALPESLELETPTAEERYDDHTPIPGLLDDDDDGTPANRETPRRRAEDFIEPRSPELDERQADLALGEPEEWTDLLEEVGDADVAEPARATSTEPPAGLDAAPDAQQGPDLPVADEDPTAEHPVFDGGGFTLVEDDAPPDAAEWTLAAEIEEELELVDDAGGARVEATGELEQLAAPPGLVESPERGAAATAAPVVPPSTEEEMTIDRLIDQDLLRLTGEQEALGATHPGQRGPVVPQHVETIIMEGEFVRSSLNGEVADPDPADDAPLHDVALLRDTYIRSRDVTRPGETARSPALYSGIAAAALLVLLLATQLVHAHRESLATREMFDDTVGAVYRWLGEPITPDWDVNGWQFQTSTGRTDASNSALTISSRITNRSEHALPYPLLHVTLTDRYEEVVGSDLLEPEQYLAIRSAQGMVDPGDKFTATVTIAPLSTDADGFKLNVCYPIPDGNVRCATGAFKRD